MLKNNSPRFPKQMDMPDTDGPPSADGSVRAKYIEGYVRYAYDRP